MNNESEMLLPGFEGWFETTTIPKEKDVITDAKPAEWPEKDVKALADFCRKNNIVGFDCGRMSPIAALAFLKRKLGLSDNPLSEKVPFGDRKPINNPNYTYLTMVQKKTVIHG